MPIIADVYASDGPTLDQLVTEVVANAQGFAIAPDRHYVLVDAITASDTTLTIEGAQAPGVYEVENELVYVTAVDTVSGVCTAPSWGRGWKGSVAEAHDAGAMVTESPAFPRAVVARKINDTISTLYPRLFGVGSFDATMADSWAVELPEDAEGVLDVRWLDPVSQEYRRIRTWEVENEAGDTTTGRSVLLPHANYGDEVRVVYSIRPQQFATGDQFWSETGLPLPIKSLVQAGTLADLVRNVDVGRFMDRMASPTSPQQQPQVSVGMQLARSMQQDFEAQLEREAQALRNRFPARQHFTR